MVELRDTRSVICTRLIVGTFFRCVRLDTNAWRLGSVLGKEREGPLPRKRRRIGMKATTRIAIESVVCAFVNKHLHARLRRAYGIDISKRNMRIELAEVHHHWAARLLFARTGDAASIVG